MNLKDILIMSANLLNLTDECEILETVNEENHQEILSSNKGIKKLFHFALTSLREICFSYLPMIAEAKCVAVDGKIMTSTIPDFVRMVKVKEGDKVVPYKFKNGVISVKHDGTYTVIYVQNPTLNSLIDEINVFEDLSPDILVLGICSYYTVSMGLYDEFEYFHSEYLKRAEAIKKLSVFHLPARRWL